MKINIEEKFSISNITIKKVAVGKNPNLLAYASLTFKGESGSYFTMSGFTVWISKFGGFNVETPKNKNFQFYLFEKSLLKKIKSEVIRAYEYSEIPVVEDDKQGI